MDEHVRGGVPLGGPTREQRIERLELALVELRDVFGAMFSRVADTLTETGQVLAEMEARITALENIDNHQAKMDEAVSGE